MRAWVLLGLAALCACSSGDDAAGADGPAVPPAIGDGDGAPASPPMGDGDDGSAPAVAGDGDAPMGGTGTPPDAAGDGDGSGPPAAGDGDATTAAPDSSTGVRCAQRTIEGTPDVRFHHIHFNTTDPAEDLAFFETFRDAPSVEFCKDESSDATTRATRTERGYFLYTKVAEPPDPTLNTYLEHVGWLHPRPSEELARLVELGVTLGEPERNQCPEAAAGMRACTATIIPDYFFYIQAPSGARIEIALGPGPATSGFGHVHLIQGVDLTFFERVSGGAYASGAIDTVNHTSVSLTESMLDGYEITDTRGKPIDHIAYSTTDLEAARTRIMAEGIDIEEDIAFRPEYGFRSFFVRSPKGIWVEMVEDSPFVP